MMPNSLAVPNTLEVGYLRLFAFIGAMLAFAAAGAEDSFQQYFQARDRYVSRLTAQADGQVEEKALADLLDWQRRLIPIRVVSFKGEPENNLYTLNADRIGFGQLDGLAFQSGPVSLLISRKELLANFLSRNPAYPASLKKLATTPDFYRAALHSDAGVSYFAPIPVTVPSGIFAHVFLGLAAQDIGPAPPTDLYVMMVKEPWVLLAYAPAEATIPVPRKCRSAWDELDRRYHKKLTAYTSAAPPDEKLPDEAFALRDRAFEAYRRCMGKEAPKLGEFATLRGQAQQLVNRLQVLEIGSYSQP